MTDTTVPQEDNWNDIADEKRDIITAGEAAMTTHRQGLARIFAIGHAFETMQQEAMRKSHSNQPTGIRYNQMLAALDRPVPELARLNKTDRNQYIWCWVHRDEIERWWPTVAQNQRDRWNHPDAVKRHYLAAHGDEKAKPAAQKNADARRGLQEELDKAQCKIRHLEFDRGPAVTTTDSPEAIARVIVEWLPASKKHAVASAMMRLLQSIAQQTKPTPADAAETTPPAGKRTKPAALSDEQRGAIRAERQAGKSMGSWSTSIQ